MMNRIISQNNSQRRQENFIRRSRNNMLNDINFTNTFQRRFRNRIGRNRNNNINNNRDEDLNTISLYNVSHEDNSQTNNRNMMLNEIEYENEPQFPYMYRDTLYPFGEINDTFNVNVTNNTEHEGYYDYNFSYRNIGINFNNTVFRDNEQLANAILSVIQTNNIQQIVHDNNLLETYDVLDDILEESMNTVQETEYKNTQEIKKSILKNIKQYVYHSDIAIQEKIKNDICPISLEEFKSNENICIFPCYHAISCETCDEYISRFKTCPLCKCNLDIDID